MIDYQTFYKHIENTPLKPFIADFQEALFERLNIRTHGDLPQWEAVPPSLPNLEDISFRLNQDVIEISSSTTLSTNEKESLTKQLMLLHPWRKGPFKLFDITIDTEWHSDWKWQRLKPHISDLSSRMVLDIGCGSGYHCWRMRGDGARFVLGIEPSPKFIFQFQCFKKYMPEEPVYVLPLTCEDLPSNMQTFDTVFSMGVLYHRRSPFDHLEELKAALRPGGELVLETLVIDGPDNTVLVPQDRYAQMRNVWFLPSTETLENWLRRLKFVNVRTVDINETSTDEQRSTDWMTFLSLKDFLDPKDPGKTIEGYPAPKRAIIIAEKPHLS